MRRRVWPGRQARFRWLLRVPIQAARRAAGGHVSVGGAPHCPVRRRHTHPWQMPATADFRGRFACQEFRMAIGVSGLCSSVGGDVDLAHWKPKPITRAVPLASRRRRRASA